MPSPFAERLADAVLSKDSALVVGLDPQPSLFPAAILERAEGRDERSRAADAIRRFDAAVIDLVRPYAVAVKPQSAYYERWGPPGIEAYEAAIVAAKRAGLLVIGDIKRGDIGSTAEAYAAGHLRGAHAADAVTVNPLLGSDSVVPFLREARSSGAGLFILVRTSNPSARELQDLRVDGRALHEHIAQLVREWGTQLETSRGYCGVGAVVGATMPAELARLRSLLPEAWFLVPGVGAQGATARDVAAAFDSAGLGAIVNSSRGILYAFGDPACADWQSPIRDAAKKLRDQLREAAHQATR